MRHSTLRCGHGLVRGLLAACLLAWAPLSLLAEPPALPKTSSAGEFLFEPLHAQSADSKAALRAYKLIDDGDTQSGKALSVRLDQQLIRKADFPVLQTPALGPLPVGVYRATVRMKVHGMLSSLGSAITIRAGDQRRDVWMNEFKEEDVYQEFSLDLECRPGDIITQRDVGYDWSIPRSRGGIALLEQVKMIPDIQQRNDRPWRQRFLDVMLARYGSHLDEAGREKLRAALDQAIGVGISSDPENRFLNAELAQRINSTGSQPFSGVVSLSFPENSTGQVSSTRGPATPHPTLRDVVVDWIRLEKLPEPQHIVVRQVAPRFHWLRPGNKQFFTVWLHNRSGKAQQQTLQLVLHTRLGQETEIARQELSLADGAYQRLVVEWTAPATHDQWGQEVEARILAGDKPLSSARDFFALHNYSNAVMIGAPSNTARWRDPLAQGSPAAQTHREFPGAAGTPNDSAGVVPDEEVFWEPYAKGNSADWFSVGEYVAVSTELRAQGIAPFFYLEAHGSADKAFELFWDHPDWIPEMPANLDKFLLQRAADIKAGQPWFYGKVETKDGKIPAIARAGGGYAGQLLALNGLVPQNVDCVIQGTLKLLSVAPLQGVRWDGLPFRCYNGKALGGNWGKTTEELQAQDVANLQRFKKEVLAKHPHFEMAANGGLMALEEKQEDPTDFAKAWQILQTDPLHLELIRDHGQIMEEIWMHYGGLGTYTNNCLNYLRAVHFENSAFKRAGGHNNLMLWFYDARTQYTPDEIYQQVLILLGGAHLCGSYGPIPESDLDLGIYALRFSEYFWDPALTPIANLVDKVEADADAPLWYAETAFQKVNEAGHLLYVLPVINPPTTEHWLQNRFGQLPQEFREPIPMTVQMPDGYSKVHAVYLLENSPYPHVKALKFDADGGEVAFEIPELKLFKVAVVEFAK